MRDGEIRLPTSPKGEACEAFHAGLCPVLTGRAVTSKCGCYHTCVLNGATALVADDDRMVCDLNTQSLTRIGMTVLPCRDGREAHDALMSKDHRFDVVVLDVSMPGMDGLDLCRAIRAKQEELPVVFATGYDGADLGKTLDQLKANALIMKPFRIEQLRHVVGGMVCPFMGQHLFGNE